VVPLNVVEYSTPRLGDKLGEAASVAPTERTIVLPPAQPPPAQPPTQFIPRPGLARTPAQRGGRARGWAIAVAVVFIILAIVIPVLTHSSGSGAAAGGVSGGVTTQTTDAGPGTDPSSTQNSQAQDEQTQLQAFVQYLTDSVNARTQIVNAVNNVSGCSENPADGVGTMQQAAQTRNSDASSVRQLPVDAIPDGTQLQNALVSLLTDSATADDDFAHWMQDVEGQSCPFDEQDNSHYQAGNNDSKTADADKTNFVSLWNADVSGTGLPTYTANQL
jgi:hypothetical protein